jgi:hypothetical protein
MKKPRSDGNIFASVNHNRFAVVIHGGENVFYTTRSSYQTAAATRLTKD